MKCFTCGADAPPAAQFCGRCGTRVGEPHEVTLVAPSEDQGEELLHRLRMVLAGEYEVEQEFARGGMAVVFKATEVGLRRLVALKVLPPDIGLTARAIERFKREARMVAELDHPNIIPVYRVGQVGGILYIAMRFIEGRSLGAILEAQGALPVSVVLHVLRGAARALAYAHDRGIVHRDVKGANILVDRDGRVMVTDFGVALRSSDVTLTAAGAVIGTPPFMSPEQCKGERTGPQSDQYSLGIVAFQMLTGSVPFHAETLAGMMQHHFFTPVPDVSHMRENVPSALLGIMHVALAKEPAARYGSTRDMLVAIEAIPFSESDRRESERVLRALAAGLTVDKIATRPAPPLPDSPTQAMRVPTRPRRPWLRARWVALTAVPVAAAGVLWWAGRPKGTEAPVSVPAVLPARAPLATGKLRMLTSPPDAQILIDGRAVGVGSVFDFDVAAGPRQLVVRAAGYRTFDSTVVVPAGGTLSLGRITLRGAGGGA
jgi:serine/threonine protein kinase